ncbi:MAG: PorT family protein [Bacteroidetes bacterium]|nr:MAG: PorT family protein [Bacteroidota bacterium]TNF00428.1 MAG: PorT family protein [Bacteroidota bacterium]
MNRLILHIISIMCVTTLFAQKERPMNYRRFDEKLIHFGFMLGGNSADFSLEQKLDAYNQYGLKSLTHKSSPGGQVGIVSTMKLGHPVVRLRFIPTISFQERVLNYVFVNPDPTETEDYLNEERINSTNLDFPLMLQFRTLRLNNFAAYVLMGGQYTLDLQSQEQASQDYIDPFIKIRKHDFQGQVGGGIELFAPYFKFGLELKYSYGFRNTFVQDGTFIADPIQSLHNKVWWFSIIFEG